MIFDVPFNEAVGTPVPQIEVVQHTGGLTGSSRDGGRSTDPGRARWARRSYDVSDTGPAADVPGVRDEAGLPQLGGVQLEATADSVLDCFQGVVSRVTPDGVFLRLYKGDAGFERVFDSQYLAGKGITKVGQAVELAVVKAQGDFRVTVRAVATTRLDKSRQLVDMDLSRLRELDDKGSA